MPQVAYLDNATEQRLQNALTKISDHVAEGDSATDAIVKVARNANLGRGQAELLVRAYNTGRTLYQFDTAKTLEEKLADFPLADLEEVLAGLFPNTVKTAAAAQRDESISSDYLASPQSWLAKLAREEQAEKHAQILIDARRARPLKKTASFDDNAALQNQRLMLDATKAAALANGAVQTAKYAAFAAIQDLANYFRQTGAISLNSMRPNAVLIRGEKAAAILDSIVEDHPQFAKQAAWRHPVDWTKAPYSLLETCITKAAAYVAATKENDRQQQGLKEAREVLYSPFACPESGTIRGSAWDVPPSASDTIEKTAAPPTNPALWTGIGAGLASGIRSLGESAVPNKESIIKGHMSQLQDPAHEQQLQQIRTQSLLADLMLNDPVISGYHQDEVMDAYTRLSEVAPAAVQHKLLAQTLMRRYLEQGNQMSGFDADQLIGIENKLKSPQPAAPQPLAAK